VQHDAGEAAAATSTSPCRFAGVSRDRDRRCQLRIGAGYATGSATASTCIDLLERAHDVSCRAFGLMSETAICRKLPAKGTTHY
jgi:hypothetical protein